MRITFHDCLVATSAYTEIPKRKILGKCRQRRYTEPRQIVAFLARQYTELSFPQIAKKLNCKDHTTVMWSFETTARKLGTHSRMFNAVMDIAAKLQDPNYRKKMNAAWGVEQLCRAIGKERQVTPPPVVLVVPTPSHESVRTRYIPSAFIPAPSKSRLMGARA